MNFQQLRIVRETVRRGFNLTAVGNALFTSQSGVSKHIKDLEDEIGLELFVRRGKRLLGLTEPGKEVVVMVERMLLDAANIKRLAEQYASTDAGQLTVATTHTQARYSLPPVVTTFKRAFPKVHLRLHQGSPAEIVQMLLDGEADIGVATEAIAAVPELISFPYYSWRHSVIVPVGHPLVEVNPLTLADLVDYPIITYHEGFTGRSRVDGVFADAGLAPEIVLSALDADVIKTYVELGLGVGIIASMAFDSERDNQLVHLSSKGLFPENTTSIAVRRGHYLRGFAYRFMELCSPELTEERVVNSLIVDGSST
ncbi:cys regulon transcriptional regulator Cbl [Betaproteobacteria bacterium]|nr:cys regulon transcriptional regulator Cbl [Betaproteobacteria bacterium]GHU04378.1 cys regulon transcriptional regulator Cbl [Betaproteobacteria bacterium]GHU14300.1 cys regulon transcriptional regulator Cbl [Betaproteobacteria bacterium]GHU23524.1 cys regulon transcriptional regulator Cbl [Betaproteobacteria bacterium]GHU24798.1 cys regulon transcriptional regulator Cbl [Betaproteobacteria bacterium]